MAVTQSSLSHVVKLCFSQLKNGGSSTPALSVGCDSVMTIEHLVTDLFIAMGMCQVAGCASHLSPLLWFGDTFLDKHGEQT